MEMSRHSSGSDEESLSSSPRTRTGIRMGHGDIEDDLLEFYEQGPSSEQVEVDLIPFTFAPPRTRKRELKLLGLGKILSVHASKQRAHYFKTLVIHANEQLYICYIPTNRLIYVFILY